MAREFQILSDSDGFIRIDPICIAFINSNKIKNIEIFYNVEILANVISIETWD